MKRPLRVAAIHDLSTFGRCALSVVIPVLSALGVQVCPVPTMLLSTHTGGFTGMRRLDCGDFSERCAEHYTELKVELEGIYSGYLGNEGQIDGVLKFYDAYPAAYKVADPAFGDNGVPYNGITGALIEEITRVLERADVITPNATEAALLTGKPYLPVYNKAEILKVCRALQRKTNAEIVITGVALEGFGQGNLCRLREGRTVFLPVRYRRICFDGTGDIFASVVTGALLKGEPLTKAVHLASQFVGRCIDLSDNSGEPRRDGVFLEAALPWLQSPQCLNEECIELEVE